MIGLFREAREILVAGHAPDLLALGVDRVEPARVFVLDQIVPDALGIVARLVGGADQHDVARMQHRVNALDDMAGVRSGLPFACGNRRGTNLSFHRRNLTPDIFRAADQPSGVFSSLLWGVGASGNSGSWMAAMTEVLTYQTSRGRAGEAIPASRTARMPVRKMPSNVPAPPIEATGAPSPPILSRFIRSAPIRVPIEPPI